MQPARRAWGFRSRNAATQQLQCCRSLIAVGVGAGAQTQLERGRADAVVARVVVSGHIKGATAIWHSVAGSGGKGGVKSRRDRPYLWPVTAAALLALAASRAWLLLMIN